MIDTILNYHRTLSLVIGFVGTMYFFIRTCEGKKMRDFVTCVLIMALTVIYNEYTHEDTHIYDFSEEIETSKHPPQPHDHAGYNH